MEIEVRKWGNSLGLSIPQQVAESLGIEENSLVEIIESADTLLIRKKQNVETLDDLLESIPDDFDYENDVDDFRDGLPMGRELI